VEVAIVVVVKDIEDNVLGGPPLLDFEHAAIRLVGAVATDAVVADGLLQVRRQVLLPRLAVADLVAMGEAVAVGVDAAIAVWGIDHSAGAVGLVMIESSRLVHPVGPNRIAQGPPHVRIKDPAAMSAQILGALPAC